MSRRAKARSVPSVDLGQVERLAQLSRLSLAGHEAERLRGQLSSILDYFASLDKVDLSKSPGIEEVSTQGAMRQDVVAPSTPEEILKGVPLKKGRYVRAPRVF